MAPQDHYRVVFDLSEKGFQWWFPAFGLIFVVIAGVLIGLGRRYHWPLSRKLVGYFMIGFACLWSGLAFSIMLSEYLNLHSAYRLGKFSVVDGPVSNFRPMPYEGHQDECFSVQSQTFCYSDYGVTSGFNHSTSHGGPIREGIPVRVSYIGNTIIRLEIRSDAVASAAQREVVAAAAEQEWLQRQANDPVLDRMTVAFAIALMFMTAWWNLQPVRFIRFWLKPPYKPRTVILFRFFFGANLVGAIRYFIAVVNRHQRVISEYGWIAGIAVAWIAVIWAMTTVVLRVARRSDQTA